MDGVSPLEWTRISKRQEVLVDKERRGSLTGTRMALTDTRGAADTVPASVANSRERTEKSQRILDELYCGRGGLD